MAKKKKTNKGINWSKQPLGKKSDHEIARKLGVQPGTVATVRRRRGIPVAKRFENFKAKNTDWDALPLGKVHDKTIAEQVGVTVEAVGRARRRRGIRALGRGGTPQKDALTPRKTSGRIDWDREKRLGKMTDGDLAAILGLTSKAVQKQRFKRGIPVFKGTRKRIQRIGVDWDKEPLGKMPDAELAILLDCAPQTVSYARESRGIPPHAKRKKTIWTND